MRRDHRKLKVFQAADLLAIAVYRATQDAFPVEERFGLLSQIRRAAVAVPANIVEGCARRSEKEYLHFLGIALASASEVAYLLDLSRRLDFLGESTVSDLTARYQSLVRGLHRLIDAFEKPSRPPPSGDSGPWQGGGAEA